MNYLPCNVLLTVATGALIYRVIPPRDEEHKLVLKCVHAGVMMLIFIIMVIGLQVGYLTSIQTYVKLLYLVIAGSIRQPQQGEPAEAQHVHAAQLGGAAGSAPLRLSVGPRLPFLPLPQVRSDTDVIIHNAIYGAKVEATQMKVSTKACVADCTLPGRGRGPVTASCPPQ